MSQELFVKILKDAVKSGIELINLQNIGEPLLDEELFERIKLIRQYGLKVMFHTNGSLMDEEKRRLILKSGVDIVNISLDAFSKETYEKIRKGLPFDVVVQNIMNLIEMKEKENAELPFVQVSYAILEENIHETKDFYNFWCTKVDHVSVVSAHNWTGELDVNSYANLHIVKNPPFLNPCKTLWTEMIVFYDGKVSLCCFDGKGKVIMGDLNTQGIMEVWLGEKFQKYRKNHIENKRGYLPVCNNCSRYSFWF